MVDRTVDRTKKLFQTTTQQLPVDERATLDPSLHVHAPFTIKLSPDVEEVSLLDLLRWAEQERSLDQETVSTLAFTLLFRLIGVDSLVEAATQEQWMQLTREIKERVK